MLSLGHVSDPCGFLCHFFLALASSTEAAVQVPVLPREAALLGMGGQGGSVTPQLQVISLWSLGIQYPKIKP